MDRVNQQYKKGNQLIGQRYLLQKLLLENSTGMLYQARDIRATDNEHNQVLVHLLIADILQTTPLKLLTERLQQNNKHNDTALLKILDSGWLDAQQPYFILANPPSWQLSSLPPLQGEVTRPHEQALKLNQKLIEQQLVHGPLPSSLFLVGVNGEVYLPSTVLIPNLPSFTKPSELLLHTHRLPKKSFGLSSFLGLAVIGIVVAGGSTAYYYQSSKSSQEQIRALLKQPTPALPVETNLPSTSTPLAVNTIPTSVAANTTQSLADEPALNSTDPTALTPQTSSTETLPAAPPQEPSLPVSVAADNPPVIPASEPAATMHHDPEPGDMRLALARVPKHEITTPEMQKPKPDKPVERAVEQSAVATNSSAKPENLTPELEKKVLSSNSAPKQDEYLEETDTEVNLPSPPSNLISAKSAPNPPKAHIAQQNPPPDAIAIIPPPQPRPSNSATPVLGAVNPEPVAVKPTITDSAPASNELVAIPAVSPVTSATVATPTPPSTDTQSPLKVAKAEQNLEGDALKANGMTSDELVKKAYQALQQNNLDEQPNRGVIYYIRLLKRIDQGNVQIKRIAGEAGYQLHQQVRVALQQEDTEAASQKLWLAGRVIKEFNLVHLNPAQEILQHKLAE